MGALMRAHDWAATGLGPPEAWPQSLRVAVRLMLTTRHPMFIFWGADLICFYNDAYRATLGHERHPSALGARGREVWDEVWDIIGPQIELVIAGRGATWHEDHLVPLTRHGRLEDVWWTYSYGPIDDEAAPNGIGGVLVVCNDVTTEHVAREELRAGRERWRAIFASMHEGFALGEMVHGPDGAAVDFRFLELNAAWERLTGLPPEAAVGRLVTEVIPGIERFWIDAYARVVATGEPAHIVRYVAPLGRWFEVYAYRTEPGRFAVLFLNVTERREAEERQALLAQEVDHRARNALTLALAILRLTRAPDIQSYVRSVEGRVESLARAQTLLAADRWAGADLRALLKGELQPFLAGEAAAGPEPRAPPRIELDGARVVLPPGSTQPLALAVHELATNALKHGALSAPGGRIAIAWHLEGGVPGKLHLRWAEVGGPAVSGAPAQRGFGSTVLDSTVRSQLAGAVRLEWPSSGLVCTLEVPLTGEPWPS